VVHYAGGVKQVSGPKKQLTLQAIAIGDHCGNGTLLNGRRHARSNQTRQLDANDDQPERLYFVRRTRVMHESPLQYRDRLLSLVGSADPWQILETTAARIRRAIAGRTLDELAWKPEPNRWSVTQILAHLADTELVGAWRFRSVLAQNAIELQPFDQNRWAEAFRYEAADPFESLELFAVTRTGTLRLLRRIDPDLMNNYGMHGERGRESASHLLNLYAGHDLNHLAQIEKLLSVRPPADFQVSPISAATAQPDSLDVRVGTIEAVDAIPASHRLMKLTVNFGDHRRTIVAGIGKERLEPQALVGRQTLFALNVAPRTMAGVESQGVLFDVGHADGLLPVLVVPERPVPDGTRAA
jgi:methionine--tRNA ligase beta chain